MANFINIRSMVDPLENAEAFEITKGTEPVSAHMGNVVVWGKDDLLTQAVGLVLEASAKWNVIKLLGIENTEWLIQELKQLHPDIVVLCQLKEGDNTLLPIRLIRDELSLRVLKVNLETNTMQFYSKQNIVVEDVSDLLFVLDEQFFKKCF